MSRGIGRPVIWPPVVRHNGPIPRGPNGEGPRSRRHGASALCSPGPRHVETGTMGRHSHKSHAAITATLDFLIDLPGCRPGDWISALWAIATARNERLPGAREAGATSALPGNIEIKGRDVIVGFECRNGRNRCDITRRKLIREIQLHWPL